jgi:branched-chain amino acid transport system ATP-binding protein
MDRAILRVSDLSVYYGSIAAVQGVSLEVSEQEVVCLLGPNGAGKSSVLNAIIGHVKARSGVIEYRNGERWVEIQDYPAHERAKIGILSVAAVENVLPRFTVQENLEIGAYTRTERSGIRADIEKQFSRFPILRERRKQFAGTLSGGQQKMLAIARALMGRPRLLLLDEPSLGLAGKIRDAVFGMIRGISLEDGWVALLVEQNVKKGLEISDRAYVMRIGAVDFMAASSELLHGDRIEK